MTRKKRKRIERQLKCVICGDEFTAKRIDAMYCTDACNSLSYRRRLNPKLHGHIVPISFVLNRKSYDVLLEKADALNVGPIEYFKSILLDDDSYTIKIELTGAEYSLLTTMFNVDEKIPWTVFLKNWMVKKMEIDSFESVHELSGHLKK